MTTASLVIDAPTKRCPKCAESKTYDLFYRSKVHKDGRASYCKTCASKRTIFYARVNKAKLQPRSAGYGLKRRYLMNIAEYEAMLVAQGMCCAICGRVKCTTGRRLAVDHCHTTGKVRGLLCSACNTGIGMLQEDEAVLNQAIRYLTKNKVPTPASPTEGIR